VSIILNLAPAFSNFFVSPFNHLVAELLLPTCTKLINNSDLDFICLVYRLSAFSTLLLLLGIPSVITKIVSDFPFVSGLSAALSTFDNAVDDVG